MPNNHPPKSSKPRLSSLLSWYRKAAGLSLREAAEHCHISAATLHRIELGKTPDLHTFFKLCEVHDLDPKAMYYNTYSERRGHD